MQCWVSRIFSGINGVYSSREEAKKVRQDWIDKINKADED